MTEERAVRLRALGIKSARSGVFFDEADAEQVIELLAQRDEFEARKAHTPCPGCGSLADDLDAPPPPDDEGWRHRAKFHAVGCPWIEGRGEIQPPAWVTDLRDLGVEGGAHLSSSMDPVWVFYLEDAPGLKAKHAELVGWSAVVIEELTTDGPRGWKLTTHDQAIVMYEALVAVSRSLRGAGPGEE